MKTHLFIKSKNFLISSLFVISFAFIFLNANSQEKDWTHFRGTNLNGQAPTEIIPLKWDEKTIKWKTEIHDNGYSSPVIFNNQIWLTTAKPDGSELYAMCIDYNTGKIIYDIKVFTPEKIQRKHAINTYASPTPAIENGFVYVHYGSLGTACINSSNGSIVWQRTDLECKHAQGPASSPVIYKNMIILHYEGTDVRFIVALDKTNGKQIWRSDRPLEPYLPITEIGRKAYTTPLIINVKGRDMMISNGSAVCIAYDPNTGKEIWRIINGAESTIAMPITEKGIVYWYAGYMVDDDGTKYTDLYAVNPDGSGDIARTNILWKKKDGLAQNQMLTPVIWDGLIYTVNTRNILSCIDASTGEDVWSTHVTSNYNASPLYINGNIWLFSVKGEVLVLKAGRKYELVAQSQMDSGIWATPAILRNSVILRTQKYLYRIAN